MLWGVGWDSTGGVRTPAWAFDCPHLAVGLQEVTVPLWVSTSQSLTLETPSMGVEGRVGQVVALSHQESPLRGKGRS